MAGSKDDTEKTEHFTTKAALGPQEEERFFSHPWKNPSLPCRVGYGLKVDVRPVAEKGYLGFLSRAGIIDGPLSTRLIFCH